MQTIIFNSPKNAKVYEIRSAKAQGVYSAGELIMKVKTDNVDEVLYGRQYECVAKEISKHQLSEEWRNLNLQINSQIKRAGKPLSECEDSEWKQWIIQLMEYRDSLTDCF